MLKKIIPILSIVILCLAAISFVGAQTEQVYTLDLLGPTWDHSTISVLIIPSFNESWWNPVYLNSTLRAINQWNEAISYFAANYTDYAYLSRLKMELTVSNLTISGFDVTISWVEKFGNVTCEAGLARTTYENATLIRNSTIALAIYDCQDRVLSETDTQNVAVHEIGHGLGLGHGNASGDQMYPALSLDSPLRKISTLDVYGLATVFGWMANSTEYNATNQGPDVSSVMLPPNIPYEYLPVSEGNVPPPTTTQRVGTFLDNLVQFFLQSENQTLILIIISVIVVIAVLIRVSRKLQI
ncbi:MAG TPA: matrixin family metalloprotease [Candidatus Sulfotelmatobacter sp.]|nr:matrixin family metalloprotease [Candidatus Sulfotelmatobacter sp.]